MDLKLLFAAFPCPIISRDSRKRMLTLLCHVNLIVPRNNWNNFCKYTCMRQYNENIQPTTVTTIPKLNNISQSMRNLRRYVLHLPCAPQHMRPLTVTEHLKWPSHHHHLSPNRWYDTVWSDWWYDPLSIHWLTIWRTDLVRIVFTGWQISLQFFTALIHYNKHYHAWNGIAPSHSIYGTLDRFFFYGRASGSWLVLVSIVGSSTSTDAYRGHALF